MSTSKHLLVLNPKAGGGRGLEVLRRAESLYREASLAFDSVHTQAPGDASRIARDSATGYSAVVAVGGDGTVHEVVSGLADAAQSGGGPAKVAALGVLPVGTGNDFVKTFKIPIDGIAAFPVLRAGRRRTIDVGRAGPLVVPGKNVRVASQWFANDFSVGFGARVARDMFEPSGLLRRLPGRLAYFLVGIRRGMSPPQRMRVRLDGAERVADFHEIHVGNGRYCGGGAQFTPQAVPDDGMFDVATFHTVSSLRNFWTMLRHLQSGTIQACRGVDFDRCRVVEIEQDEAFPVYLDGDWRQVEPVGSGLPAFVRVELVPAALDVLVPAA